MNVPLDQVNRSKCSLEQSHAELQRSYAEDAKQVNSAFREEIWFLLLFLPCVN